MTRIEVDGESLDLSSSIAVAITFQKINVGELSVRYLNRTNQFDIPRTKNNDRILENAADFRIQTTIPYTLKNAKVIQNGIEVIPFGYLKVVSATNNKYQIQILENLIDVFSKIKGKKLKDISPITDTAWDAAGIDTLRTSTSNVVSALMMWGKSGAIYQSNYFLPCFYYSTIINKILQLTGLSVSGSVFSSSNYTDLVIPYPNESFIYPQSIADAYYDTGTNTSTGIGGTQWALGYNDYYVNTNRGAVAPYGRWASWYLPASTSVGASSMSVTFSGTFTFTSTIWSAGTTTGRYWMSLMKNGVEVYSSDGVSNVTFGTGGTTITALTTQTAISGDQFNWRIRCTATGGTLTANSAVISCTNSTALGTTAVNRTLVNWNALWRDINCEDLLRDFLNRFAIIPKQVGNTLVFKTLQEIMTDTASSLDWSSKRIPDAFDMRFDSGYALSNTFEYKDSDFTNEAGLGTGTISLTYSVDTLKTIFSSVFQKAKTQPNSVTGYGSLAQINVYDSTSTSIDAIVNTPSLSVLMLRARTTEPSVTFNTTARTDYKLAYFVDTTASKDAGFRYFVNQYYGLFSRAIQSNKIIKRKYLLTELDVANLDPHVMIYDDGYYILNKVNNFVPGKATEVELFKAY